MSIYPLNRNIIAMILILVVIVLAALGISNYLLYKTAFNQERLRMIEIAQSQARLIEAIAQFNKTHSKDRAFNDTMSQVKKAHKNFIGFGETGEFTLAKREGDKIVFLLSHRHHRLGSDDYFPFHGTKAEPMRRALKGESGSLVGIDYRGEIVLAAYEPVSELDLGIVVKIDLHEIKSPFITTWWESSAVASLLILIGSWLLYRITVPMFIRIEKSEKLLDDALNAQMDTFFVFNPETSRAVRWNNAFRETSGYTDDEIAVLPAPASYYDADDLKKANEVIQQVLDGEHVKIEMDLLCKDGHRVPTEYSASIVSVPESNTKHLISSGRDITERKKTEKQLIKLNAELKALSFHDGLTGIINRRMFDQLLENEWERAMRNHTPLSLMMIDIDYFKDYNDHYGHQQGDECLKKVAQALSKVSKRAVDIIARYGGEEFVVLLPETSDRQSIALAETCLASITEMQLPHEYSKIDNVVTISIGVSTITPSSGTQSESLLKAADVLLYQAKENGRNQVAHT